MKTKGILATAFACLVIGMGAVAADAANVNSFLQTGPNAASDQNAEYQLIDLNSNGLLDRGDVIVGGIDFNTLNSGSANLGGTTGNDQWTGVFGVKIRDIVNRSANLLFGDVIFEPWGGLDAYINGGAFDSGLGLTVYSGLDTDPVTPGVQLPTGPAVAAGTMARMWTNPSSTTDFNSPLVGSPDANVGLVADGAFYWDIGFAAPGLASQHTGGGTITSFNGEGWVALNGGTNLKALATVDSGVTYNPGNFGVNVLQTGGQGTAVDNRMLTSSWTIFDSFQIGATPGQTVEIKGSSTVRGSLGFEANAGFDAGSNTDFSFNLAPVPLPGAAWMGIAMLVGLGAVRIRRRKDS